MVNIKETSALRVRRCRVRSGLAVGEDHLSSFLLVDFCAVLLIAVCSNTERNPKLLESSRTPYQGTAWSQQLRTCLLFRQHGSTTNLGAPRQLRQFDSPSFQPLLTTPAANWIAFPA